MEAVLFGHTSSMCWHILGRIEIRRCGSYEVESWFVSGFCNTRDDSFTSPTPLKFSRIYGSLSPHRHLLARMDNLSPETRENIEKWGPYAGTAVVASVVTIGGVVMYSRFFKRFPTAESVPVRVIQNRGWIKGVVTRFVGWSIRDSNWLLVAKFRVHSVGDADNFRLYHTPGPLFLWRFPFRLRSIPTTGKGKRFS